MSPARPPPVPSPRCELGRVLALDPGSRRIGVAVSDPLRLTAGPLRVIDRRSGDAFGEIREIVGEYQPDLIVVGLPVSLRGGEGAAAAEARRFGEEVGRVTGLPVEYVDERFTTRTAESAMLEGGVRRRDRRDRVDKVAAAVILQQFLEKR